MNALTQTSKQFLHGKRSCTGLMAPLCFLALLLSPQARGDSLATVDGRWLEGEIHLEKQGFVILGKGPMATVKATDVLLAFFDRGQTVSIKTGIILADGTSIAGVVKSINQGSVRVEPAEGPAVVVDLSLVAMVIFQPGGDSLIAKTPRGAVGLVLSTGDFCEGDCAGFDGRQVQMDSALLGEQNFSSEDKAVALVLRPAKSIDAETVVRLIEGTTLAVESLVTGSGHLHISSRVAGAFDLPISRLESIRCTRDGRLVPLANLQSLKTEASQTELSAFFESSSSMRGFDLSTTVLINKKRVWKLDGANCALCCRFGLPQSRLPTQKCRFGVVADGTEVYLNNKVTTIDVSGRAWVNMRGVKCLEIQCISENSDPILGVCTDSFLVNCSRK